MREYVVHQTAALLRRLAYQVSHTSKNMDEAAIHDLRVSIRRLNRCLRAFAQFYPGRSWKKIRRKLKNLMEAAGEVRDRDIAAGLMLQAGIEPQSSAIRILLEERAVAAHHLSTLLKHWKQSSSSRKWREDLGL